MLGLFRMFLCGKQSVMQSCSAGNFLFKKPQNVRDAQSWNSIATPWSINENSCFSSDIYPWKTRFVVGDSPTLWFAQSQSIRWHPRWKNWPQERSSVLRSLPNLSRKNSVEFMAVILVERKLWGTISWYKGGGLKRSQFYLSKALFSHELEFL
jgi:hypothetical protein